MERDKQESETEKQKRQKDKERNERDRKRQKKKKTETEGQRQRQRNRDTHRERLRHTHTHTHTHTRRAVVSSVKLIFPVSPVIWSQRFSSFFSLLLCPGGFTLHITNSTGVSEVGRAEEAQVSDYRMCWWNLKKHYFQA